MKKTILFVLIAFFSFSAGFAQSLGQTVIGNSGATISGGGNTLSFTVGEPVIGNIDNGESLGQGFWLGAIEGAILSADDFGIDASATVYPNPVSDFLNITFEDLAGEDFEIMLYDVNGRAVMHKELNNSSTNEMINFSPFSAGIYMLKVVRLSTSSSKTFKIIKK